jgi:hypothetical protein
MTGTYLEERSETEEIADDELNPVLHSVHPGIVRRQLYLPGVDLHGDDVATPARDAAAARLLLRAGGVREQNCKCIRVPDGELDGVAAAAGEGVDDEVAGRGAGGLRRRDSLRGGGVPALGIHALAAVVGEKRLCRWDQYLPAMTAAASARASMAFARGSSAASARFGSFGLATSRAVEADSSVRRRWVGFLAVAPPRMRRKRSGVLHRNEVAQVGRRRWRGAAGAPHRFPMPNRFLHCNVEMLSCPGLGSALEQGGTSGWKAMQRK